MLSQIGNIVASLVSFAFISAVSGLVIRVLIANASLLLLGISQFIGAFFPGHRRLLRTEVVIGPHSWLRERAMFVTRAGRDVNIFLGAHTLFMFVVYSLYEAGQLSWSFWFYDKSFPQVCMGVLAMFACSC